MAIRSARSAIRLRHLMRPAQGPSRREPCTSCRIDRAVRSVSTFGSADGVENALDELEQFTGISSDEPSSALASTFDPLKLSRTRKTQLPASRFQFRPPKYDRGPLHPHQPPPPSDPSSRVFVPGPFSSPQLEQNYHNRIAPDLLTLFYQHRPPGFEPPAKAARLRGWDDSSPYHINRPLRGPRGGDVLRLLRKPISYQNIPKVERVTVHSYVKDVVKLGSPPLHVAGMILQAITNVRVETHKSRTGETAWGIVPGKFTIAATASLRGEDMYHFLGKLINVVLPRIKDWQGVKPTSGDGSGNLSFGLDPDVVGGFPEIEVNYDAYPPKMIPGCNITIHTSAATDKDARLLLQAMGIPFGGKVKK